MTKDNSTARMQIGEESLLSSMRIGPAGKQFRGEIWSVRGIDGHVAFGPYCKLPAEGALLQVSTSTREFLCASDAPSGLFVEALYGDVVLGLASLSSARPQAVTEIAICIPHEWAPLLREPKFEARISSYGNSETKVVAITLQPTTSNPMRTWKIADNLLALLCTGNAGHKAGRKIEALEDSTGTVFYGPYRGCMPGRYRLGLRYQVSRSTSRQNSLLLEVVKNPRSRIASTRFAPREGRNMVELEFDIPRVDVFSDLSKEIEFRLSKKIGSSILVEAVELELLSPT